MSLRITGKLPTGAHKKKIQESPQYREGAFQNLSPTPMKPEGVSYWKMMREFFKNHPETKPAALLPSMKTDLHNLLAEEPFLTWFGHSSYFIRIAGRNFLVDPVFSGNAAPLSFMVKAFPGSNEYRVKDLPEIDYLVLTHDHYDHLDYSTIRQLRKKTGKIYCSLGIGAHLQYWGMDAGRIHEMDWWQQEELEPGLTLTAAPARHFSGRGLKRGQSLWSSFILQTPAQNLYLGGDSGYDSHFKEIGNRFGPFDLAILEAGQYNTMWPLIHMFPEETVRAALDLRAKSLLPVHWGKFRLSMHPWHEPIKRILAEAAKHQLPVSTPRIGEPLYLGNANESPHFWWESGDLEQ